VNEQFTEAETAFERAYEHLEEGTGDLSLLARALSLEATLRKDQRRVSDSVKLFTRVHDFYIQLGERHSAGEALVCRGVASGSMGDPIEAVRCLELGISLLDRSRDPQLVAAASYSLAAALTDSGDYRRAGELLLEGGFRQTFAAQPLGLLRLRWLEGKVHAGLGRLQQAERIFRKVREGFQERDLKYDAALVGLDLASVWLRLGKAEPVRILAEEMLATFESMEIRPEASKARLILKAARSPR
jgi:tetratricopeptide (TPR) repeat protein